MGTVSIGLVVALVVAGAPSLAVAETPSPWPDFSRMFNVGFSGEIPSDAEARVAALGGEIYVFSPGKPAFVSVRFPDGPVGARADEVRSWPGVKHVENDGPVELLFDPSDPLYSLQWGPPAVQLPAAWDVTRGDHSVTIAILDTGVNKDHADLAANYCKRGTDFTGGGWRNLHWHATHVMGIAAGVLDNGVGIAGAANACVLDVRVLDGAGRGQWSWIAAGIKHAADEGADVISMSLGGSSRDSTVEDALKYAYDEKGVLVVSAAGNSGCGSDTVLYPAKFTQSMAVSALASESGLASFSSCGPKVEVAAPGANVYSAYGSGYGYASGTSMATPLVSGVAALFLGQVKASGLPLLLPNHLLARCALDATADDLGDEGRDRRFGFGRLDAAELVNGGVLFMLSVSLFGCPVNPTP